MSKRLANNEELGRLIAQTSGAISVMNESNYRVRSTSSNNTFTVIATESGVCSCPDYASHNAKCKHVFAVEFYHSQSTTF
jgi:predicted nucleic acid-binding Zn finger protein